MLLTEMEHHANLVPWLQLKAERGIELRYLPIDSNGQLVLDDLDRLLDGVKLLGVTRCPTSSGRSTRCGSWPTPRTPPAP